MPLDCEITKIPLPVNDHWNSFDDDGKVRTESSSHAESNGGGGDLPRAVMAPDRAPEVVNRSTAKQRPRRQWLVENGRGKGKEQNPSAGFTGNLRNHGESSWRFRGTSTLRLVTFRSISGGKDDMDT